MLATILCGIIVLLLVVIWSIKRHREPKLRIHSDKPLIELLPSLAGLTHATVVEGNCVEIFENGAFFDVLLEDMRAARRSVHFETYLWEEGELSRRVTAALTERARAGVAVRVLVDASGGDKMGDAAQRELRAAGCHLRMYHKRTGARSACRTSATTASWWCWTGASPSWAGTA